MKQATLLIGLFGCMSAVHASADRPNIMLILVDDLGYSDLGCMGGEIPTPNIDRLASSGLRFTQCYNSSRCCPSRASLMTGLYPHQAGIGSFVSSKPDHRKGPAYLGHLNDQCVALAEILDTCGYQTFMVGKWHLGEPGPMERGFREFYGYVHGFAQDQWDPSCYERLPAGRTGEIKRPEGEFYATDVFTDYALEFLRQARDRNSLEQPKPWFLYLSHSSPHFPLQAPKASVEKFITTYQRGWDVLRKERFDRMVQNGLADRSWNLTERSPVPVYRTDATNGFSGKQNPAWDSLPDDRKEDIVRRMAIYAAMVSHVDQGIGRLVSDLKSHDEFDNTLILFLSDNGACYEWGPFGFDIASDSWKTILHTGDDLLKMGGPGTYHSYGSGWANLCNTPLRLYKHFTYEGGNCTPLIVHWPDGVRRSNDWIREPIHVMDIMPTLSEVAQAEYPTEFSGHSIQPLEGMSLSPFFTGGAIEERPIASEHNGSRSLRFDKWKLVQSAKMPWGKDWELYNLSTDRCETRNLANEYPSMREELEEKWIAWAQRVKVYPYFQPSAKAPARAIR